MAQEVEDHIRKLGYHDGVAGTLVVNNEGIPIRTTFENEIAVQYAGLVSQFVNKARIVVKEMDNTNDLTFLRLRSKKNELMIAPEKEFLLIAVQNPTD